MTTEAMKRLNEKAKARAIVIKEIARILWENGEMLEDTDEGSMPSWVEVVADDRYREYYLSNMYAADALMRIRPADALILAKHLIDGAARWGHWSLDVELGHTIERAKGFEPGSLTGARA